MRVLLLQGQSVYDPSSGAAQSMRQVAEALAFAGCDVRSLCTTGCENGAPASHWQPAFHRQGLSMPERGWPPGTWIELEDRGVRHQAVVTAPERRHHWETDHGPAFDQRFDALLSGFAPQVLLTFGADSSDHRRRAQARRHGVKVVLMLHNLLQAEQPRPEVDACWVPSGFMRVRCSQAWGRDDTPVVVPTPLAPYLRAAPSLDATRVFVTFINPEPAKGVAVVAGLLHRWLVNRPQQPLLIVEGRATAASWWQALKARGVSPQQCEQVFIAPNSADLSSVWASTRVLLMPSVVEESAGRVALEAMLNGVVPVVSNRGALPETVGEAGWVQALPPGLHWQDTSAAEEGVCASWDRAVSHWLDDDLAWQAASLQAVQRASQCLYAEVAPIYLALLAGLSRG